ncbi:hypothetical protein [Variovorax sp. RA8]|uniref:hypothetical protein n=1 Tax=Variovorax sp. (strain JCM 16519 / RA8) TaxID=662548 RepID=UPI00131622D9|nr:hypothetical protein [Variovorax sp. RA8]VTU28824.1 hypothetical protein RA8CHR_03828 [Variovorax sp. RA8]
MNRWQGWARQLRRQHGRRDAWHARGAMVLLQRGGGLVSQVLVTSWRAILQVHAHLGVVRPVSMPAATLMRQTRELLVHAPRASLHRQGDATAPPPVAAVERERPAYPALRFPPPVFAQGHRGREAAGSRNGAPAPRLDPAAQLPGASRVVAQAAEIVTRVHRRALRQELVPPSKPLALAAPQRMPAPAGAAPASEWMPAQTAPMPWEQGRAPAAAPAVSVEALTGLVIQQIDRRLIAYRERMGRV